MALTTKSIADGQLSASSATLYTCTEKTHAHIHLANTSDVNTYKINILIKRSGSTARSVSGYNVSMPPSSSADLPDGALAYKLSIGDEIVGYADTANVIDYTITGGTE